MSDDLEVKYVPLAEARRWERNPKKHDIPQVTELIRRYGFKDPPKWEPKLNAIVEGNGRLEALATMKANSDKLPRGLRVKGKEWLVPILYGVDAASKAEAEAYGVDHNNSTMSGATPAPEDLLALWEGPQFLKMAEELTAAGDGPVTFGEKELALLHQAGGEWEGEEDMTPLSATKSDANIRPVIAVSDVPVVEAALRKTGKVNRAEAFLEICRSYLEER